MTQIDAIYQNGVFKPLQEVGWPENQQVRLSVQPIAAGDARSWLARIQQRHREIIAKRGYFPDSAADIAEDRRR